MDMLAAVRTYAAIVEHGSLSAAAIQLDRAAPTVVRSLALLEQHLGVRLLNRTTRNIAMTPDGRVFYEHCRRILADIAEAEAAVRPDDTVARGDLRLTAPVMFGERYVVPSMLDFARRFPAVHLDLQLLDRPVNLLEEAVDLALRIGPPPDATTAVSRLGHMRRVIVGSPALIAEAGMPDTPRHLAELPCVLFHGIASGARWEFGGGRQVTKVSVRGRVSCNQAASAVTACIDGLGFGRFLAYQVDEAIVAGQLVVVLEDDEPPALPVSLLFPHATRIAQRVRVAADHLRDSLTPALAALKLAAP